MGTFRDISERKQAEKILCESNKRLSNILENTRDVIWSSSWPDLKVQFISSSAKKVFGRPLSEFYENNGVWKEVVHPDDRRITEEAFELLIKNGTTT